MKTKKPTAKLPAPSVTKIRWSERRGAYQPAALIPTHTAAQARQIVKAAPFLRMTEGEKVEAMKRAFRNSFLCFTMPENETVLTTGCLNVLRAMGLGGGK